MSLSAGYPFAISDNVDGVLLPQLLNQQRCAAQCRFHEHYEGLVQRTLLEQRRHELVLSQRVQGQLDFLVQQRARQQLQEQQNQQQRWDKVKLKPESELLTRLSNKHFHSQVLEL
jgi:hypothetical protein